MFEQEDELESLQSPAVIFSENANEPHIFRRTPVPTLDVEELVVNCLPIVVGSVVLDLASIHGRFSLWRACFVYC